MKGFAAGLMLSISFFDLTHNALNSLGFLRGNLWVCSSLLFHHNWINLQCSFKLFLTINFHFFFSSSLLVSYSLLLLPNSYQNQNLLLPFQMRSARRFEWTFKNGIGVAKLFSTDKNTNNECVTLLKIETWRRQRHYEKASPSSFTQWCYHSHRYTFH